MGEIRVQLPDDLLQEIEGRIQAGLFADASELICAAIRYYAERHTEADWQHDLNQEIEFSRRHAGS